MWAAIAGAAGTLGGTAMDYAMPFIEKSWASTATRHAFERTKGLMVQGPSLTVEGLRKAGINPILAAGGGLGGGVNAPRSDVPSFDSAGDSIGQSVSSALQAAGARDNLKILKERATQEEYRTEQEKHNVWRAMAEATGAEATAKALERNRDFLNATLETDVATRKANLGALLQNLELQRTKLPSAKAQAEFDSSEAGQTLNYLRRIVDVVRP